MKFLEEKKSRDARRLQGNEGFALIVALALMALAILVLLSMTILTRVETTVAGNSVKLNQAQENARMALNIAIGELQRHAGPDNRITAPANMIDPSPPPGAAANYIPHPYWTGVWEPTIAGDPASPLRLRSWLVSGNENNDPSQPFPPYRADQKRSAWSDSRLPASWDATSKIRLVSGGSVPDPDPEGTAIYPREVIVPLRPIFAQDVPGFPATDQREVGRFAYWVGDEGVKADVAVHRRDVPGLAPIEQRLTQFLSAQSVDARNILGRFIDTNNYGPEFNGFQENLLSQILDFNQLTAVMNPAGSVSPANRRDARKQRFHDLTVHTRSLLTNPVDGRLKVDLSARNGSLRTSFTGPPGLSTPQLDAIFDYLKDGVWSVVSQPASDNDAAWVRPILPILRPTRAGVPITASTTNAYPLAGAFPVMTKAKASFRFYIEDDELFLDAAFVVELWNPYSHAIDFEGTALEFTLEGLPEVIVSFLPGTIDPYTKDLSEVFDPEIFEISPPPSGLIEPGETLVYSGGAGNKLELVDGVNWLDEPFIYETEHATVPTPVEDPPVVPRVGAIVFTEVDIDLATELKVAGGDFLQRHQDIPYVGLVDVTLEEKENEENYQFSMYHGIGDGRDGVGIFDLLDPRNPVLVASNFETEFGAIDGDGNPEPEFARGLFGAEPNGPYLSAAFFELPRVEPHSIASLQHVAIGDPLGFGDVPYTAGDPAASVEHNLMFDRYFFSALPRPTGAVPGPLYSQLSLNPPQNPPLLDNARIGVIMPGGALPSDENATDEVFDPELAAMHFWAEGGFNVNSTSLEAWTAVLGGISGSGLDVYDGGPVANLLTPLGPTFARLSQSAGTTLTLRSDTGVWEEWDQYVPDDDPAVLDAFEVTRGMRELTSAQIRAIAREIVDGIRERNAPFASMAEFLTWKRTGSGMTVLEEAVAQSQSDSGPTDLNQGRVPNSPFYITQRDIMSSVGATWTVRSDTFRVRAYGAQVNPVTGAVEGRAWCEAIVQRTPEPYTPGTSANPPTSDITAPNNLGRKFEIVSFRWLNANEI